MRPFKPITWIVFAFLAMALVFPARATQSVTNLITLDQCIQLALEHNLGLRIARLNPMISQYELSASYSIYDPRFEAGYRHTEQTREGDIVGGTLIRPFDLERDAYSLGLVGELPTGLTYDMGFTTDRDEQALFGFDEFGIITNSVTSKDYNTFVGINLRQPLLDGFWINQGRAAIKIAKRDVKISENDFTFQIMDVVRGVQVAYFNLLGSQDFVKVQEKALQLATQLWEENKKRVQAGTMAPLDEKQAESEKELARANLIAAERDVLLRENILKRLITDNFEKWQDTRLEPAEKLLAIPETFDRGEAWINALEKRPDYASVKLQLERQGIQVKLRKNQLYPSLDLVGSYGRSGLDTRFGGSINDIEREDNPTHSYGVVLSVPLFNQSERNRYRSAKEVEKQLELEMQRVHQEILAGVDDAITQAQSAFEQIPARRQAKTYAEQALDAEQKKYENGKSTSFFVLEFQRDLTSARAEEIRSLADYNRSLAEFYFSEGTILERNNILIEKR